MDEPKIEFPCDYPIKVIVDNDPAVIEEVRSLAQTFDPKLGDKVEILPSKKGNYVSVRLEFWATGPKQIEGLFKELKKLPAVRMVI